MPIWVAWVFTVATSAPSTYTRAAPRSAPSVETQAMARPVNVVLSVAPDATEERRLPPEYRESAPAGHCPTNFSVDEPSWTSAGRMVAPATHPPTFPARSRARTSNRYALPDASVSARLAVAVADATSANAPPSRLARTSYDATPAPPPSC